MPTHVTEATAGLGRDVARGWEASAGLPRPSRANTRAAAMIAGPSGPVDEWRRAVPSREFRSRGGQRSIYAIWFTYDAVGKATWLSVTAPRTAPDAYSGTVYRSTGPAYSAPPGASAVTSTAVGKATLAFADLSNGTFTYAVNGVSQTKAITREIFASPPTVCE